MNANTQPNDENPADGRSASNGGLCVLPRPCSEEPPMDEVGICDGVNITFGALKEEAQMRARTAGWYWANPYPFGTWRHRWWLEKYLLSHNA